MKNRAAFSPSKSEAKAMGETWNKCYASLRACSTAGTIFILFAFRPDDGQSYHGKTSSTHLPQPECGRTESSCVHRFSRKGIWAQDCGAIGMHTHVGCPMS